MKTIVSQVILWEIVALLFFATLALARYACGKDKP